MNRTLLIALLCCLALLAPVSRSGAQWRHYANTDDIRALYRQGDDLYIGTNGGVLIYDLLTEEMRTPAEIAEHLPSQSVWAIEGRGGVLYFGTDRGLLIAGPDGFETYSSASRSYFADIRRISFGYTGDVFLGTFGHGAVRLQGGRSTVITRSDSLLDDKVFSVYEPDAGTAYYATALGLCAYKDEAWINYQAGYGLPRGEVLAIEPADARGFYVLIGGKGIYRFDGERGRRIPLEGKFKEQDIAAIAVANDGALWAAGRFGELRRYRYGDWTAYDEDDSGVRTARWRCASANDYGDLFFGAWGGLIARIKNDALSTFSVVSSLPSNVVSLLLETPANGMLLICGGYLVRFADERFETIETPGHVLSVAIAPDSAFWYATRWGLFRQEGVSVREVTPELPGLRNYFTSLAFDSAGALWVGSYAGLIYRFDGEMWMPAGYRDELCGGAIDQLAVDAHNRVWALDRANGISRFSAGIWDRYPREQFGGDSLKTLLVDRAGYPALLTGTAVWRYRDATGWYQQNIADTKGYLSALTFDSKGTLCVGSMETVTFAYPDTSVVLDIPSGLRGSEIAALMVDRSGRLWIGFQGGGLARARLADLQ